MSSDPGWRPDPYGRYQLRYHDGTEWTEHVVDGDGTQLVDPMGRSAVTPIVLPTTATGTGSKAESSDSPWPPPDPSTRRG